MNYKISLSESAKNDIKRNAKWYNKKTKGLGKRFTQSISDITHHLKIHPNTFQIRYKSIRFAIPKTFPFLVLYKVEERKKVVQIIAVVHSAEDPKKYNNIT